ncbi:amidohydrolase [Bacillus sp. 1P06AnD]|uniref:amidohydrolase n=1 Tax=Bacillus sp. 1P06AnD TaxID=3132208 RepID=UPI00399F3A3F
MTLYKNGKIFTSNEEKLFATAMIVENKKISWIGDMEDAPEYNGEVVDLEGSRIIPGFVDAHIHPLFTAISFQQIACTPPTVLSIKDMIEQLKEKGAAKNGWIQGWGYDEGKLSEGRTPTRHDLDQVSEDIPVAVKRTCFHILSVNSKALEEAGITKDTPDPEGGQIDRDPDGEPTGILREAARFLVEKVIPLPDEQEYIDLLVELSQQFNAYGITSMTEMYGEAQPFDYLSLYRKAYAAGMKQKTAIYYHLSELQEQDLLTPEHISTEHPVFIAGIKLLADGSVSGRTAWVEEPFEGGGKEDYGLSTTTPEILGQAIKQAREKGVQVAVHAMGEQAIKQVVDTFAKEEPWLADGPTFRVEHAAMPTKESIAKAGEKGIAFVPQTIFQFAEIESYLANLGEERTKNAFPIPAFLEAGIPTALSSDAPATAWSEPADPFITLKAAVTRRAYTGEDIGQEHSIDIETAVKLYTRVAQQVTRIPDVGQLKEGYSADFLVLNQDLLACGLEDIAEVHVLQTYIGGEKVFEKKPSHAK